MKKKHIFLCVSILVALAFRMIPEDDRVAPATPRKPVYRQQRLIQYGFTVSNTSRRSVNNVRMWVHAPVRQTATQLCGEIRSNRTYTLLVDDSGNQVLRFDLDRLPPLASREISISARVAVSRDPNDLMEDFPESCLQPATFCESDHPAIVRLANELKRNTVTETAENIFRWVAGNVGYAGYLRNHRGALYALDYRSGDCSEFMFLFAALCRAGKIPAQCVGGYVLEQGSGILKSSGYHHWAYYKSDLGWRLADPQRNIFMRDEENYIVMRILDGTGTGPLKNHHKYRVKGEGVVVRTNR